MPIGRPTTSDSSHGAEPATTGRRTSDAGLIASTSAVAVAAAAAPPPLPVPSIPAPGLQYSAPLPQQTRPHTVKLTPSAILSLPHRLAHPPPAKGQLPSWGVIPAFDIRLEDVLDRKHLPPLGLKDFEEWLVFVDHAAENLYFILWLREYTARYTAWAQQSKLEHEFLRDSSSTQSLSLSASNHPIRTNLTNAKRFPFPLPNTTFCHSPSSPNLASTFPDCARYPLTHPPLPSPCPSPTPSPPRRRRRHHHYYDLPTPPNSLALFYLRAKETFLTPNAEYELDVPSDVLSIFHLSSSPKVSRPPVTLAPPPDPAIFNELASIIEEKLKESLAKFVVATYNNVGMPRAHCGSAGGLGIGIIWSLPILATNFSLGAARWWRVIALPGMWLGLTVFISAMYGVCMMIYIFGDLRQLRSFELTRPSISPPQPLPRPYRDKKLNPSDVVSAPIRALTRPPRARVAFAPAGANVDAGATGKPALKIVPPGAPHDFAVDAINDATKPSPPVSPPASVVLHTPIRVNTVRFDDSASIVSSYSYSDSDSETEISDDDFCSSSSSDTDSEKLRTSAHNQRRRPRIIISDAFYDEHPSPEGPATAPTDTWNLTVRQVQVGDVTGARRGSVGTGGSGGADGAPNPLWPDYEANAEEETNATATFIKPFLYDFDNYRFGTAPFMNTASRSHSDDIEAQAQQRTAELQPIDSFDFDALPPKRPRPRCRPSTVSLARSHASHKTNNSVVGILHSDNAFASLPVHTSHHDRDRKSCWTGQLRMKLGVEVVQPRKTDAQGRVCEKPKSTIAIEGKACVPGDAGHDGESVRGYRRWAWVWRFLGMAQDRCSTGNTVDAMGFKKEDVTEKMSEKGQPLPFPVSTPVPMPTLSPLTIRPASVPSQAQPQPQPHPLHPPQVPADVRTKKACPATRGSAWRQRFKKVSAVPPFASPLTPVLNPIVGRAQWEIVMRSAVMAAVVSVLVTAALLCVPVKKMAMAM